MSDTGAASEPADHDVPTEFTGRSLGYQVNLLARMMEQALAERIRPHGVVPGQFAQLMSLYESDGQSVTELAAAVAIEHSTMSRTLARMERDGLVETRPHPSDGRSRQIHLTERARELESVLHAEANAVNESFLATLSPEAAQQLLGLIKSAVAAGAQRDED